MTARTAPSLLPAMVLVLPGTAVGQLYSVYVGTYTAEPPSGTPPPVIPGRPAPQPSTSRATLASGRQ